jgi:quinol monooxygenase YgiN
MIHVIATIELAPGKRDEFLAEFHTVMPLVQTEDGCIEYGPTIDVPTDIAAQIPQREDVVTVVEKWDSLQALNAHLQAEHMQVYRQRVKDLVLRTQLQILKPA